MGRCLATALALLACVPPLASAQVLRLGGEEAFAPGRINVAAYAGYRYRYAATFDQVLETSGERLFSRERVEVDAAPVVGAALSVPLAGRFAVVGSATYGFSGSTRVLNVSSGGAGAAYSPDGGSFLFAKAGFSYQFFDSSPANALHRVAATASLAPALIRTDPPGSDELLESDDPINHYGFAVAASGIIPLTPWPSFAIDLGIEDFVAFWNVDEMAARLASDLGNQLGNPVQAAVDADPTNIAIAHVGLRVRF